MDIRSLGYAIIDSADPAAWLNYGTEILGMMVAPMMPDDGNVYLKMDARPFRFCIRKADADRLAACGFELADQSTFEDTKTHLQESGVDFEEASAELAAQRKVRGLISLQDPSGNTLELYWGADLDYA